jgi:hypothetical protein
MKIIRILVYGLLSFCVPAIVLIGFWTWANMELERGNVVPANIGLGIIFLVCAIVVGYAVENL